MARGIGPRPAHGMTYGNWTVDGPTVGRQIWCMCACGSRRLVFMFALKRGESLSCGCISGDLKRAKMLKHGEGRPKSPRNAGRTKEYCTWDGMIQRCGNPNNKRFAHYGGRGISVCERWRRSFEAFLLDMGRATSSRHTIDRINNDGNYEPGNCRWATYKEQNANTSRTLKVEINGTVVPLFTEAIARGTNPVVAAWRHRHGWPVDLLFVPLVPHKDRRKRA